MYITAIQLTISDGVLSIVTITISTEKYSKLSGAKT